MHVQYIFVLGDPNVAVISRAGSVSAIYRKHLDLMCHAHLCLSCYTYNTYHIFRMIVAVDYTEENVHMQILTKWWIAFFPLSHSSHIHTGTWWGPASRLQYSLPLAMVEVVVKVITVSSLIFALPEEIRSIKWSINLFNCLCIKATFDLTPPTHLLPAFC